MSQIGTTDVEATSTAPRAGGAVAAMNRYAGAIKWTSAALIVLGVFLFMRVLPVQDGLDRLAAWLGGVGAVGRVVFGAIYVAATVLLIPGSVLTVAAGAIFGLWWGTVIVSISSTSGAAAAFIIARYLARGKVQRMADRNRTFAAVDRAVSEGGWKIVALLRLSPAVPFNLQNYLYGLTAIRFWPCVLTSWLAMLPGTFMYVYIGYLGRQGVAAAGGGAAGGAASAGTWTLRIVGFAATVAVTVYVTRLARRAIREQTRIAAPQSSAPDTPVGNSASPQRWPWGATVAALVAVLTLSTAAYANFNAGGVKDFFRNLFGGGPPKVTLTEAYKVNKDGPKFDHAMLDALLKKHVDADGFVDYKALKTDAGKLDAYLAAVAKAPFDDMGRNQKLALLINAYNAFTLRLILDHLPVESIKDIPSAKRWDARRWRVGGHLWSLNEIEHEQIRPRFIEPRVHFALVCAAFSCPKLRNESYTADRIDAQLEDQAKYVHSHGRWFVHDADKNVVYLTQLYDWYASDFEQVAGSVLKYVAKYDPAVKAALDAGKPPRIDWLDYDWKLNSQENKP